MTFLSSACCKSNKRREITQDMTLTFVCIHTIYNESEVATKGVAICRTKTMKSAIICIEFFVNQFYIVLLL